VHAVGIKMTISAVTLVLVLAGVALVGTTEAEDDPVQGMMIDFGYWDVTWVEMTFREGMNGYDALQAACDIKGYKLQLRDDGSDDEGGSGGVGLAIASPCDELHARVGFGSELLKGLEGDGLGRLLILGQLDVVRLVSDDIGDRLRNRILLHRLGVIDAHRHACERRDHQYEHGYHCEIFSAHCLNSSA